MLNPQSFSSVKKRDMMVIKDVLLKRDLLLEKLPKNSNKLNIPRDDLDLFEIDIFDRWMLDSYVCYYLYDLEYDIELTIVEKGNISYIWSDTEGIIYKVVKTKDGYDIDYGELSSNKAAILDNIIESVLSKKGKVKEFYNLLASRFK